MTRTLYDLTSGRACQGIGRTQNYGFRARPWQVSFHGIYHRFISCSTEETTKSKESDSDTIHVADPTSWTSPIVARGIAGTMRTLSTAQLAHPHLHLPSATPNSLPATLLSFVDMQHPSPQTAPGDVMHEAALKKKVKGNEESVWSEMGCPRVSIIRTSWVHSPLCSMMCLRARPCLSPNMFS